MRFFGLLLLIVLIVAAGCAKPVDDGSLPPDQAEPVIQAVKNFVLPNGQNVQANIDRAAQSLRSKGHSVIENGWRAYRGPDWCGDCKSVHYVITIDKVGEKYEFLVKDGGKTVEGQNDGTRVLLNPPTRPEGGQAGNAQAQDAEQKPSQPKSPAKTEQAPTK